MVVRVPLKGLHSVDKKLASGETATYHYAWRGGPRILAEYGTPAFHAEFAAKHTERKAPNAGTLHSLIAAYKASTDFKETAPSTQRAYLRYLSMIEQEFGKMPLAAVEDKEARGDFKEWRDGLAASPRAADYAWQTLVRVLSFGVDRGKITVNVCARGGRLYRADRAEKIWTADHIERFIAAAYDELRLALALALWTGQRQGDLLKLGWSSYKAGKISLKQSKTGRRVTITVGETLRQILAEAPRRATTILCNTEGLSWTGDGFRSSWAKACAKAKITDVTFHDLRGTAVTRLALAGASIQETAAITGHSPKDAEAILDKHYLGGRVELAEAAMIKLEAREQFTKRL